MLCGVYVTELGFDKRDKALQFLHAFFHSLDAATAALWSAHM
jgi:hypothetical protein